jgi:hypothetical protein
MRGVTQVLLVPFVAGFIVQWFLEILDPFTTAEITDPNRKRSVLRGISLAHGWWLAGFGHIAIFNALKWQMRAAGASSSVAFSSAPAPRDSTVS